jgi:predicted peroxiredoxin
MAKKVCSIIDTAYRATLEEQDDTAVWFNHILRQSGADITILLTGNAVNYAVRGQQPPALRFGTASIDFPPRLDQDLHKAAQAGVKLVLMRDDAALRGIPNDALLPEVEQISREQLADFLAGFDLVWHW